MNGRLGLVPLYLLVASSIAHANTFTDLGTLGSGFGTAVGVNDFGQVVGYSNINFSTPALPTLWSGSSIQALDLPSGTTGGEAQSINLNGQVAGWALSSDYRFHTAMRWDGGTATQLGGIGGGQTFAYGINDAGQVVGASIDIGGSKAVLWNANSATAVQLSTPNYSNSYASNINNYGQIVGVGFNYNQPYSNQALLWDGASVVTLSVPGRSTWAMDINDSGQIAGYTQNLQTSTLTYEAGYWNGTAFQDLGYLPGGRYSYADAINNNGQLVGWGDDGRGNTYALLWADGNLHNLNDYLDANAKKDGWIVVNASDISNTGFVVGAALNIYTHAYHAYVLSINDGPINGGPIPVPEPGTYVMLLMGLGLLAYLTKSKAMSNKAAGSAMALGFGGYLGEGKFQTL